MNAPPSVAGTIVSSTSASSLSFVEVFSGNGKLSAAVKRLGVPVAPPQDLLSGGVDFSCDSAVRELWLVWDAWVAGGAQVVFHFAPPCATFSRARDRSHRTRLRSTLHPEGIPPLKDRAKVGNRIAANTAMSIAHLVALGAMGTMENPALSYLWPYLEQTQILAHLHIDEVVFHQCRYGTPYKKPTRLWCFGGFSASSLAKLCYRTGAGFSCGRATHEILEFGGLPTAPAASYPDAYCAAHAALVYKASLNLSARDRVEVTTSGRLKRHIDREKRPCRPGKCAKLRKQRHGLVPATLPRW